MGTRPFCICFYCICRHCIHVMPGLRRRGGNGERRSRAHGVARSHWRVLYHIRRDEIAVRMKSNPPRKLPRKLPRNPITFLQAYTVKHIQKGLDPFVPTQRWRVGNAKNGPWISKRPRRQCETSFRRQIPHSSNRHHQARHAP